MGLKKKINYAIGLVGLLLLSAFTMCVVGALSAIVTGSYTSVLGYLFR